VHFPQIFSSDCVLNILTSPFFSLEGGSVTGKELTGAFVLPEIMGYNGGAAKSKK
jgi:hypothetical protein